MRLILIFVALTIVGCGIPKDKHMAVQKDLDNTRIELANTQKAKIESEAELNAKIEALNARVAELEKKQEDMEAQLADANASLSMYESKTGGLEKALKTTKKELDILRKQRVQTEKRLAEYRKLAKKLASMVASGTLQVKVRNGKMVIQLADNILFESGKTTIKKDGEQALAELAVVLTSISKDRSFLVSGHTDNVPMSSGRFKSNWELSTARAVNVVSFLQNSGVPPTAMAAAGYGEFDPVASNDTTDGKAQNRRIEIVLMPNLDELPSLPKSIFES